MGKIIKNSIVFWAAVSFGTFAQANSCDTLSDDPCAFDGYSIVEAEPNVYWPHNEMAAAHWVGYRYHKSTHKKRVARRRATHYRKRVHHHHKRCRPVISCRKSR